MPRKWGGFKQQRFSKLHAISKLARKREIAQFGCQNGQNCLQIEGVSSEEGGLESMLIINSETVLAFSVRFNRIEKK